MLSFCGSVILLTLSNIVDIKYVQGIQVRNATSDGHLEILDETGGANVWKTLATSRLDIPSMKVLCRTLGLPSDDVTRMEKHQQPTFDDNTVFMDFNCVGDETTIDDCQNTRHQSSNHNSRFVRLQCKALSFELYGGGDTDGLVLARHNGQLALVCSEMINQQFAAVVCQNIGFNVSHPMLLYPEKYRPINIRRVLRLTLTCLGQHCELHTTNRDEYCDEPFGDTYVPLVAVYCVEESNEYRLRDKTEDGSIGRLDVKINGTWGTVCAGAGLDLPEQACRAMNLPSTDVRRYKHLYYGGEFTSGSLTMNYHQYGMPCFEGYMGISCEDATDGKIRLHTGSSAGRYSGEVQIYHDQMWLGVGVNSSKTSALKEATVICRTLNFSTNGVEWHFSDNTNVWLSDINCVGDESKLSECKGTSLIQARVVPGRILTVSCGTRDNALRLENDGLLMIKRSGLWGTVNANAHSYSINSINNIDAALICKALNKSYTLAYLATGNNDPKRTGTIWSVDSNCNTTNDDWQQCLSYNVYRSFGTDNPHDNDVYIKCGELDKSKVQYRLTKGPVPQSGYLEMFVNNIWGTVCKTGLSEREAKSVCRSMNLTTENAKVISSILLEPLDNSKVWINRLQCQGTEASILDCAHNYLGAGECRDLLDEKLAVYCGAVDTSDDFSLRIVGDSDAKSGRLEIKVLGEWGTICEPNFDDRYAWVACSNMNLQSNLSKVAVSGSYSPGSGPIWMAYVTGCRGDGSDIDMQKCKFSAAANAGCTHAQDVGVTCTDVKSKPTSRAPNHADVGWIIAVVLGSAAFVGIVRHDH